MNQIPESCPKSPVYSHKEAQEAQMYSQNPLCFLCLFVARIRLTQSLQEEYVLSRGCRLSVTSGKEPRPKKT